MDKHLVAKVKTLLSGCNQDNFIRYKKRLMVELKPDEADMLYEHFTRVESDYIKEKHKVFTQQVIPQYNEYFYSLAKPLNNVLFDGIEDYD